MTRINALGAFTVDQYYSGFRSIVNRTGNMFRTAKTKVLLNNLLACNKY